MTPHKAPSPRPSKPERRLRNPVVTATDHQSVPRSDSDTGRRQFVADLRRRREASWRLPVLASGRSDPWHYDEVPLTDCQLDAWLATIAHLADRGIPAIVPVPVRRALRERVAA
jgi:hypothetical protein